MAFKNLVTWMSRFPKERGASTVAVVTSANGTGTNLLEDTDLTDKMQREDMERPLGTILEDNGFVDEKNRNVAVAEVIGAAVKMVSADGDIYAAVEQLKTVLGDKAALVLKDFMSRQVCACCPIHHSVL